MIQLLKQCLQDLCTDCENARFICVCKIHVQHYILHLLAVAIAQSPRLSWISRLGNLVGHGVTLIKGLFHPTSDHITPPPEIPVTTQPATHPQHPAQKHTGMAQDG